MKEYSDACPIRFPAGLRKKCVPDCLRNGFGNTVMFYAALCPETGDLCSLILPYSNTDCMQIFLEEFARQRAGKPTLLIMDQAAWHKSSVLQKYPDILITYQPPYSPELNPVEHLWKHLRTTFTHNWFWSSLDKLEDRLCEVLFQLSKNPQTIKSFSLFDWMICV